jgi:hypothetical protein
MENAENFPPDFRIFLFFRDSVVNQSISDGGDHRVDSARAGAFL